MPIGLTPKRGFVWSWPMLRTSDVGCVVPATTHDNKGFGLPGRVVAGTTHPTAAPLARLFSEIALSQSGNSPRDFALSLEARTRDAGGGLIDGRHASERTGDF